MRDRREVTIQGPLVRQPQVCARLAATFISAAEALWDAAALDDPSQMWEDGRAAASWVLSACDRVEADLPRQVQTIAPAAAQASDGALFDMAPLTGTADPG